MQHQIETTAPNVRRALERAKESIPREIFMLMSFAENENGKVIATVNAMTGTLLIIVINHLDRARLLR